MNRQEPPKAHPKKSRGLKEAQGLRLIPTRVETKWGAHFLNASLTSLKALTQFDHARIDFQLPEASHRYRAVSMAQHEPWRSESSAPKEVARKDRLRAETCPLWLRIPDLPSSGAALFVTSRQLRRPQ